MVHPGIHIAKYDIRSGTFSCLKHFHTKVRAPNPPSNQGRIKDHRFHESILGSPKSLILFRLGNASGRICSGINQQTFIISVNKKSENTG